MKKSILLMLCCFFYLSLQLAWSQDYKLVWGNADLKTEKLTPLKIVGKDKTGIYVFAKLGSIEQLVKYDLNMNYLWNTSLQLKNSKNKTLDYLGLVLTANKIILFVTEYDKATKSKKIYASYVSQSGVVDQKYQNIYTFQEINSDNELHIELFYDKKESSTLIMSYKTSVLPNDVIEVYADQFINIDENLIVKEQYLNKEPKIENAIFYTSRYDSDNFFGVYSVIKELTEGKEPEEEFYLTFINERNKIKQEYKLNIGEYVIADVHLSIDTIAERYAFIYGYYFDKSGEAFLGTYSIKVDLLNKKVEPVVLKPFDATFLNLVSSITIADEKTNSIEKQKNKASLKDYEYREAFTNDKGWEITINEQSSTSFSSMQGADGHTYNSSTYYFKDILVTAFDSTGDRAWSTIIPKYQKTYQRDLGSVYTFTYNGDVYVIYRDNAANGTSLSPERYVAGDLNTCALVCVKIDANGQMKKSIVMPAPTNKTGVSIKPEWMELIDNEVILIGFQDGNYKIGKVILE